MSINNKENEIELVITWKCNWHCSYCCVDTHNKPQITKNELRNKLLKVPDCSNVTLSGGEIGTMKEEDILFVIESLINKNCILSINTNGLFIEKYPHLLCNFDEVLYHCSENIDTAPIIVSDSLKPFVVYMLVITDKNFSNLEDYLAQYPNIEFSLVEATNPEGINGDTLSKINKIKLITSFGKKMSKESLKRLINEKDWNTIKYI